MIAQRLGLVLGAVLAVLVLEVAGQDYCDKSLCRPGRTHIGCDNPDQLGPKCVDGKQVEFDDKLKQLVLDTHNNYRNMVAKGELPWLNKAATLGVMQWDDDLAYLARLHANRCSKGHDECRNTKKYPSAGQNLAMRGSSSDKEPDYAVEIPKHIELWWKEKDAVTQDQIDEYYSKSGTGHFTLLARDKANRIGCAMVWYKDGSWYRTRMTCDYSYTNMIGTPGYTSGEPCSGCKSGCDKKWDGLCSKDESYEY
ncbi:antigen 5 like allergen Cul n 1-like [Uranotaenia lowii]|uniref:antigen 5 like allergen Cul n 1-like n=1 Tax=Uranotaenia lowii TaxID=190385 RepID=UPI0024795434|nr:antigen 5 like allergen Cul n 1-like [Uranotaenia lowii]